MWVAKIKYSPTYAVLLVVGLIFAGICGSPLLNKHGSSAYKGPPYNLSTGLVGEYASSIRIAQAEGYFRQQGINLTIKNYTSGPAALNDVIAGKVDVADASDFAGVSAIFSHPNVKIIANVSKSQAFLLVARKDHGINSINDLKGKRIGLTADTVGQYYLGQFLTFNDITEQQVTLVNMTQPELVSALAKGDIDASVVFEPNGYTTKRLLGSKAISWSVQGDQSIYTLLYCGSQLTDNHPEVLTRYMRAVTEGEQFITDHSTQAKQMIAGQLGDSQAYINYIWPNFQFQASLDQELLINMENEATWSIDNNLTSVNKVPNYLDNIDLQPLLAVNPNRVSVIH